MYILFPLCVSSLDHTHLFSNFFYFSFTNHRKQSRKQSCKALMFYPTAVKYFNLFNVLASDDALACRFASQAFQRCGGSKFRMNFPEMLNAASINRAQARAGTCKRDAGKWLIMYRVSATFSGCNRAYRGELCTVHPLLDAPWARLRLRDFGTTPCKIDSQP